MSGRGSSEGRFDAALNLDGPTELPRTYPAYKFIDERSAYPMLVTFGDLDDPASVERVDPDDLAAIFGEGVALKRITVQLTDDPVTTGTRMRLPSPDDKGFSIGMAGQTQTKWASSVSGTLFREAVNESRGISIAFSS